MDAATVFAVLFFIGFIVNIITGTYDEAAACLGISATLAFIVYNSYRKDRKVESFLENISQNREILKTGPILYEGIYLTPDTEITRFDLCIGLVLFCIRDRSRYFIKGHHNIFAYGLLFSVVTFLLGWIGLPAGPVYTVKALAANIRGGHKQTIRELIEEIEMLEQGSYENE